MIDRLTIAARRVVERMLPWYDPAERNRRAAKTETIHKHAIAARQSWERDLASYRRARVGR